MANTKSAAKRARQSDERRVRNRGVKTAIKTQQKRLQESVDQGDTEAAAKTFKMLASQLDKAAKRRIIHRNAADRRKSRFNEVLSRAVAGGTSES